MGLIVPTGAEVVHSFAWETAASATTIAFEKIEADPALLPGHTFSVVWVLANCNPRIGTGMAVDLYYKEQVDFFAGAPCSLGTCCCYHATIRARFYVAIFCQYSWERAVLVTSIALDVCEYSANALQKAFQQNNITVGDHIQLDGDIYQYDNAAHNIRERGRIVILCNKDLEDEREFMLYAFDHGMTEGDYVFISLNPLFTYEEISSTPWKGDGDRDDDLRSAYETVLYVKLKTVSSDEIDDFLNMIPIKMAQPPFNYSTPVGTKGNLFSPYLHDATLLYAIALNKSLEQGNDPRDGEAWFENVKGLKFEGMSGTVIMDENGDREPDYLLLDLRPSGHLAAFAEVRVDENAKIFDSFLQPIWSKYGTLDPPSDKPSCGFLDELCDTTSNYSGLIIGVCVAIAFCVIIIVCAVYIYSRHSREKMGNSLWKIQYSDLKFVKTEKTASFHESYYDRMSLMTSSEVVDISMELAWCQSLLCVVRRISGGHLSLTKNEIEEFKTMRNLHHDNVNKFIGICLEPGHNLLLSVYCAKGMLMDILENDDIRLDWMFRSSFMFDIVESSLGCHGNLKTSTCVVDKKWALKVTGFGCGAIRQREAAKRCLIEQRLSVAEIGQEKWTKQLWTAPELLRESNPSINGTKKGDVYSFGVILQEIIQRKGPFPTEHEGMPTKDIVNRVRSGETPPFRPVVLPTMCEPNLMTILESCFSEDPESRLDFKQIKQKLIVINNGKKPNVLENALQKMERYADNLEELVEERTAQLTLEKKKTDMLLCRMLPTLVAEKLKAGVTVDPESYAKVTVFFSNICGFNNIAAQSKPMQIVDLLNDVYTCFDEIIERYDVYKVETINDAYMVVSGLPKHNGDNHAFHIANLSLDMLTATSMFQIGHMPGKKVTVRIGINSGSCAAGVVGVAMPRYCLFGDTINVAARMESSCEPMKIHCSKWTYHLLNARDIYQFQCRGEIEIKGKGYMKTFYLIGTKKANGQRQVTYI
uniref:Guanylate cyclase n=1 Tax=Saccoglossus kowalevskii TaxID=10224 RepID=A0ABM0MIS3_SACKO|nr:PREDICTED: atrial natriuretic peptide receptor 1-like [Saccoglossus kowalevskii]